MAKAKIGFYRPHERVGFDNTVLDPKTGELVTMPSMTKQEFLEASDINNILQDYKPAAIFNLLSGLAVGGTYEDLPDELDYQDALNTVMRSEQAFATLPSKVRDRFDNDPAKFLEFMSDPANTDEAIKLGLAKAVEQTPSPSPKAVEQTPSPSPQDGPKDAPSSPPPGGRAEGGGKS